jgi:hypothetical protein
LETVRADLFSQSDNLLTAFVNLQYVFWFLSTYLMIFACFRYVAGADPRRALYLALSAPVLLIPIIAAALSGTQTEFLFLSYSDPDLWSSLASLMYFSSANHNLFYEIVLIAVVMPCIAFLFCRNILRSLATFVCFYLSLAFVQAFLYVCSAPRCVFVVESDIPISIFVCYYCIVFVTGWLLIFLYPEFEEYRKSDSSIFTQGNFTLALLLAVPFGIVAFLMSGYLIDLLFLFGSYFSCFYVMLFMLRTWKDKRLIGLNTFLGIWSALMIITFFLTCWRFFVG